MKLHLLCMYIHQLSAHYEFKSTLICFNSGTMGWMRSFFRFVPDTSFAAFILFKSFLMTNGDLLNKNSPSSIFSFCYNVLLWSPHKNSLRLATIIVEKVKWRKCPRNGFVSNDWEEYNQFFLFLLWVVHCWQVRAVF